MINPHNLANDEARLEAAESESEKIAVWPMPPPPTHPLWSECWGVAVKRIPDLPFIGMVGKIGPTSTWEFDDGLPGKRGQGRAPSREAAIIALCKVAEIAATGKVRKYGGHA